MELIDLSRLVDQFGSQRDKRLAADKVAAALKKEETALKGRIIHEMIANEVGFAAGTKIRVKLKTTEKPVAYDWPAIYGYMIENDAMDIVQKRLGMAAVKERFDEGDIIPGIEFVEVNDVSVGKL